MIELTEISAQRPQTNKQQFGRERDLVAVLQSPKFLHFESNGPIFQKCEVPIGECIPDMLIVAFDKPLSPNIWPKQWSYIHTSVVWLLRQRNFISAKSIAQYYHLEINRISPILKDLLKSGAITELRDEVFSLSQELREARARVIAIEAKINRWREALDQARNYQRFADCVAVAIDPSAGERAKKGLQHFKDTGVGLFTVHPDGPQWLIQSHTKKVSHPDREYILASASSKSRQALWVRR